MIYFESEGSDIIIKRDPTDRWHCEESDYKSFEMDAVDQEDFIKYIFKNKPELIQEIICKECIEHSESGVR